MKGTIANGVRLVAAGRGGFAATLQTFVVKILILVLNMGTGVLTARFLGPEGRGEQAAMILWPQLLAFMLSFGLPKSLLYNIKKHPQTRSPLFAVSLVMVILLGMVSALIGIILIPSWLAQYSPEVIHYAQWLMLTAPLSLAGVTYLSAFEAEEDFTSANKFRYLLPLATLLVLLGLIFTHHMTPFNTALAYLLPGIPMQLWMMVLLWKRYRPHWQDLQDLRQSFQRLTSYGLRSYSIELVSSLSVQIGQALTVGLLSAASMGLYTVALSLSRMLNIFEDAINTVLLPKSVALAPAEVVALTGKATRISAFLTVLCIIPLTILGPIFLKLLYGSEFVAAVSVLNILFVEVMLAGMTWILAQAFMALGKPGVVTVLQLVGLGITVPLMMVLIPRYQLVGAGLALLGSTIARLLFVLISYPLFLKIAPPNLMITLDDLRFIREKFKFTS